MKLTTTNKTISETKKLMRVAADECVAKARDVLKRVGAPGTIEDDKGLVDTVITLANAAATFAQAAK